MIANNMNAHTIGENLIKYAYKKIVRIMIGDEAALKINKIPIPNDTVTRHIRNISADIKEHTIKNINNSRFTLQVDDSTVSNGKCYIIRLVCFIDGYDIVIVNQFLCLKELNKNTKGKNIFEAINFVFFLNNCIL